MSRIVTDSRGRKLELRRVGVLETLRLYKAVGATLSENDKYIALAQIGSSVAMIDGIPVPFPASEAAIEALLERLGNDGVEAAANANRLPEPETVIDDAGN